MGGIRYPSGRSVRSMESEETCTIKGLSAGRRFVRNIWDTESAFRALAPSPYTVSVGNATVSWRFDRRWAATLKASRVSGDDTSG